MSKVEATRLLDEWYSILQRISAGNAVAGDLLRGYSTDQMSRALGIAVAELKESK